MAKPLIGITLCKRDGETAPRNSYYLHRYYPCMVGKAGGIPVLLPFNFDGWDLLDGVIFAGGGDVGEVLGKNAGDPGESKPEDADERDPFELTLFHEADKRGLPILGICRGCQFINCALGGSLVRDIPAAGFKEEHRIEPLSAAGMHPIIPEAGSLTERLLNGRDAVCSHHHQAVKELGAHLHITARSPEGIVEAIEHENKRILGLQCHPESMEWLEPFQWLVTLAQQRKNQ